MNVLFIHVPKTGGTSIIKALGIRRVFIPDIKGISGAGTGSFALGHSTYKTIVNNNFLTEDFLKEAFIFSFVRNPYEQVASHWAFSRQNNKHRCAADISFLEFCRIKLRKETNMRPQVDFIANAPLSFLGRFESLRGDVKHLASALGISGVVLPHLNKSSRQHYSEVYCPESLAIVNSFYSGDFEKLGYEKNMCI